MRGRRRKVWLVVVALLAALTVACSDAPDQPSADPPDDPDVITVGSFDFAESDLLAEIYSQALEADGYRVERRYGLGPREFVLPALVLGFIDFVPEYAGTAVQFLNLNAGQPSPDRETTHAALALAAEARGLTALAPSGAEDANAFVMLRKTAEEYGLERLSDLEGVSQGFTLGGPPECPIRPLCLEGLKNRYKLTFGEVVTLDPDGARVLQALQDRLVDVAVLFSTDPTIRHDEVKLLADDQKLQPAENVTPLVRTEIVERWGPSFRAAVDAVSAQLSTRDLQALNGQVAADAEVDAVAAAWLAGVTAGSAP